MLDYSELKGVNFSPPKGRNQGQQLNTNHLNHVAGNFDTGAPVDSINQRDPSFTLHGRRSVLDREMRSQAAPERLSASDMQKAEYRNFLQ